MEIQLNKPTKKKIVSYQWYERTERLKVEGSVLYVCVDREHSEWEKLNPRNGYSEAYTSVLRQTLIKNNIPIPAWLR